MTTEKKALPAEQSGDDAWEGYYDWDTSTQVGIGTGIISTPIVLGIAEMLRFGVSGFVVAAIVGGGGGFLTGKAISSRFKGQSAPLPFVEKLKHANWKALLIETEQEAPPDEENQEKASTTATASSEPHEMPEVWDEGWYDGEGDAALPSLDTTMFTFSELLETGFQPSLHKIFLGRLTDGTDVFVEAKDLCHVALAGTTGNGKSSLMRLIMAQLCKVGVRVLLLNPHYMLYDRDHHEDWTPFTPYLERPPIDCAKTKTIAYYLRWMVEKTLAQRVERARSGGAIGKPYFVVIDELPAIVAERRECAGYIAKLLREGRKYGIFLIVASQDFQVKTTGMDGGAARKCFRTACYVGGDAATANALLEKQATPIPETDLGKGVMMLRCSATRSAVIARVPYVDNESLYKLLGPSAYKKADDEAEKLLSELEHMPEIDADDSRYEVATPSVPPSESPPVLRLLERPAKGRETASEAGAKGREGAEGAHALLTELEAQVGELFFVHHTNPNAIVKKLWPDIKGGDAYQKKSAEVADAIRKYTQAKGA